MRLNQKGFAKVTREIEAKVKFLKSQQVTNACIASQLGISDATVGLLLSGKYRFALFERTRPPIDPGDLLKKLPRNELARLVGWVPQEGAQ